MKLSHLDHILLCVQFQGKTVQTYSIPHNDMWYLELATAFVFLENLEWNLKHRRPVAV